MQRGAGEQELDAVDHRTGGRLLEGAAEHVVCLTDTSSATRCAVGGERRRWDDSGRDLDGGSISASDQVARCENVRAGQWLTVLSPLRRLSSVRGSSKSCRRRVAG